MYNMGRVIGVIVLIAIGGFFINALYRYFYSDTLDAIAAALIFIAVTQAFSMFANPQNYGEEYYGEDDLIDGSESDRDDFDSTGLPN